jgi:flagellar protein FliS
MALGYSRGAGAYQQVRTHGGVEGADPHGLITMLMDGAIESVHAARGHMLAHRIAAKGEAISKAIEIVDSLQGSLNPEVDTPLVGQLQALYDYMSRRLLQANMLNDDRALEEVSGLITKLRESWVAIPPEARTAPVAGAAS